MKRAYSLEEFVERFGSVYEHSPWVAERCFIAGEAVSPEDLILPFRRCVDSAESSRKLKLIRSHPDLAGRAAVRGQLTDASTSEQSSAGLDQCSPQEFARFQELNAAYHRKFGFPFVMAVRNSSREEILAAFAGRLDNDEALEFRTAIEEIHKIASMRLRAMM